MTTLVQDNKTSNSLTQDSRTAVTSLTQDSKTTSGNLWSAAVFPWTLDFPWQWSGNGQILTLDTRH